MELRRAGSSEVAARDRYTFAQARQMSDSVAQWLREQGISGDTKCALLAANSPRWVAAFLGILAAGGVAVPLDTALNPEQVRELLLASDSALLFVDSKHRQMAEAAAGGLAVRVVPLDSGDVASYVSTEAEHSRGPQCQTADADGFIAADVDSDAVAAILYSSGTTGDPKGVMLTHDNLRAETDSICRVFVLGPGDSLLGILPLFHALALVINMLLPMAAGGCVVFLESLNTTELLRALPSVNIFVCVPQFFYLIHERIWKEVSARGRAAQLVFRAMLRVASAGRKLGLNLGKIFFHRIHTLLGMNMRYLATGGSRFDAEIGREFQAMGFVMLQGYGLTETTGCATYTPPGRVNIASVGQPLPGLEIKILDPQPREGTSGPPAGEVAFRGRVVMKGYYKRPDATAAALHDGWLHTGDLGYLDAAGNLVLTGRAKEIIVLSSGKNIYPEEIEAHYQKSPLIKEICVLGMEGPHPSPSLHSGSGWGTPTHHADSGERLHGVIVPNFELLRQKKIVNMREALRFEIENLSAKLPSSKRILSYEIWQDDLPRTTTRKLKRFAIERRVREREAAGVANGADEQLSRKLSDEERHWLEQPGIARAMKIVREAARRKDTKQEIYPTDNLELDLGLDSMERVELLVALERELGAHVADSVVAEVYTVRELIEAVRQGSPGGARRAEAPGWAAVLASDPDDPEVLAVIKPTPAVTRSWYLFTRTWRGLANTLFHLKVEGLEKLPDNGPFILAPNHQSFLDPPVLMSVLPWRVFRHLFYVGTSEIFGSGWWRYIGRSLKLIPVDPDANLVPAMRAGAYGLRHGKVLVLYPEGERSIDGVPKTFKKGAAILAAHLRVPIYPVAMDGFHEAWPRGKSFQRFARLRLRVGDPVLPSQNGGDPERMSDQLTRELRSRVMGMWNDLHRELYGAEAVPQPEEARK